MKGMGLIELFAMILLKRQGLVPARDLLLLFNCDEESGGDMGAKWMVEYHYADLDPEYVLDEGSAGSKGIYTDDGRTIFGVSVAEKQVLWLKMTAKGDSGHGSMPGKRNAVEKLAWAIGRLPKPSAPWRDSPIIAEMKRRLGKLASNSITDAMQHTTVTATTLAAGVGSPPMVNVIPGTAAATVDCRLLPEESADALLKRIESRTADPDVSIEILHSPEPRRRQPYDVPLYWAITESVKAFVPEAVTVPVLLPGGTDARFFRAQGAFGYGFEPMVRTREEEELIHGDNERIRLSEFHRGIRIYHHLLSSFLK
jgi:acetylornithine deacetylase/succinyl-diaminopimelate desuccinylase-like protein